MSGKATDIAEQQCIMPLKEIGGAAREDGITCSGEPARGRRCQQWGRGVHRVNDTCYFGCLGL